MLVSTTLLGREIKNSTVAETNAEKDKFMVICYILRSDEVYYKKLLDDLTSSANCGRDKYLVSLIDAFNFLVRESREYDTVRQPNPRFRDRG